MPEVAYADVRRLIQEARAEREQFEAFLLGYMHGYQDCEAGNTFESREHFEEHVSHLFGSSKEDS